MTEPGEWPPHCAWRAGNARGAANEMDTRETESVHSASINPGVTQPGTASLGKINSSSSQVQTASEGRMPLVWKGLQ